MDITFKCPTCDQELEVDSTGAGSTIECPSCSTIITVPMPDPGAAPRPTAVSLPKEEKHFVVPHHEAVAQESLIQKPNRPLDIVAKEGDKTLRIKSFRRIDCMEVGKDHFDEVVSRFLEKVGQVNIVSVTSVNYSYMELGTRQILTDYGVLIVYRG